MSDGRTNRLESLCNNGEFDIIVIGGGVNGIGVYRELALQGLRVLLIERNDFCSGCSAAPSRMIHGGLRYLENGEFGLVRESLEERDALLRNAPHMVQPLPTVIPITSIMSGILNSASQFLGRTGNPASRGALPIKIGLSLYDWVTRKNRILPPHTFHSADETQKGWPAMTRRALFSAVYYDAWISHPERLCLEMLRDIRMMAPDSVALNYAELSKSNDGYRVVCRNTGDETSVGARAVVNATGAWLDDTARALGSGSNGRMVSGTKGSHLILDNPKLVDALKGHMVYFENVDQRVCIAFPYLGNVLVGATDIRVPEAKRVRCEETEKIYILESLQQVFPDIPVSEGDIVFSFSGIRPLPTSDHNFTGRISRGHSVQKLDGSTPQFCMIGGKWTTFRAFAEETTDVILEELGRKRQQDTRNLPIGGGIDFAATSERLASELVNEFDVTPTRAEHLIGHYGTLARAVQSYCVNDTGDRQLAPGTQYTRSEIRYLIKSEYVERLSDVILRRTSLAITGQLSLPIINAVAEILANELKMPPGIISEQKAALIEELEEFYGVSADTLALRNRERSKECA